MFSNYLKPVSELTLAHLVLQSNLCLGHNLKIHTKKKDLLKIKDDEIINIRIMEDRNK